MTGSKARHNYCFTAISLKDIGQQFSEKQHDSSTGHSIKKNPIWMKRSKAIGFAQNCQKIELKPQESTDRKNLALSDLIWSEHQDHQSITCKISLVQVKAKSMLHSVVYWHGNYSLIKILQYAASVSFYLWKHLVFF